MKLSEAQKRVLRHALDLAIDYQYSVIEAHITELYFNEEEERTMLRVPKDSQKFVEQWKRDIKKFQKMRRALTPAGERAIGGKDG